MFCSSVFIPLTNGFSKYILTRAGEQLGRQNPFTEEEIVLTARNRGCYIIPQGEHALGSMPISSEWNRKLLAWSFPLDLASVFIPQLERVQLIFSQISCILYREADIAEILGKRKINFGRLSSLIFLAILSVVSIALVVFRFKWGMALATFQDCLEMGYWLKLKQNPQLNVRTPSRVCLFTAKIAALSFLLINRLPIALLAYTAFAMYSVLEIRSSVLKILSNEDGRVPRGSGEGETA